MAMVLYRWYKYSVLREGAKVQGIFGWYLAWAFGESAGAFCLSGFLLPSDGRGGIVAYRLGGYLLIVAGYLIMRLRHHFKHMKAEPEQPMNDSVLLEGKFDDNFEV